MPPAPSPPPEKAPHRARVTNGSAIVSGADGRSLWVRRLRDLLELYISDLGGPSEVSEAERAILRRAATLTVELERMEQTFALAGEATATDLDLYSRVSGNLRRLLEATGIRRRARDITPTLEQYLEARE